VGAELLHQEYFVVEGGESGQLPVGLPAEVVYRPANLMGADQLPGIDLPDAEESVPANGGEQFRVRGEDPGPDARVLQPETAEADPRPGRQRIGSKLDAGR